MAQPATISVCMIVKNEGHQIAEALSCFRNFADEIIVVDTGSDDDTKLIARKFTPRVYDFPWCNDFARARNVSFERATKDYIIWLDADDRVDEENQGKINRLKEYCDGSKAFFFVLQDVRAGELSFSLYQLRCVPNRKEIRFEGRIHERLDLSVAACGLASANTDILIHHHGYGDAPLLNTKIERNLELLEEELSQGRDDEQIHFYLAFSYGHLGRLPQAIEAMKRALHHLQRQQMVAGRHGQDASGPSPFLAEAHLFLAERLLEAGEKDEAVRHMARAQTLSLDDAHNLFRLGLMHQQLESHQTALRCLSQAYGAEAHMGLIPRKPLSKGILLVQMAYSFLRVGDQPAAKKCIEVAASLGSEIHDSWEQIGLSALKTSQVPLALHAYESALQSGPLGADGYNNLGLLYSKCGLPHKARHCYQEAIQKDPSHQEALINLAHLELQAGRLQTARELFRRLVQGGRRDPDVLVGLGFIALQLNDREDMSQLGEIIAETRKHNSPDSPPGTGNPFQDLSARLLRDGKPELARWARSIADKSALTTIHFEESRSI